MHNALCRSASVKLVKSICFFSLQLRLIAYWRYIFSSSSKLLQVTHATFVIFGHGWKQLFNIRNVTTLCFFKLLTWPADKFHLAVLMRRPANTGESKILLKDKWNKTTELWFLSKGSLVSSRRILEGLKVIKTKIVIKIFRKNNFSYPLIHTRMCMYQEVRNVAFSENFANLLSECSLGLS